MSAETIHRDTIVIGASAGGVRALLRLIGGLPRDLPAAVLIVQHVGRQPSILPQLLARNTAMAVRHGVSGMRLQHGHVYVAPPDRHMLVVDESLRLTSGPRENMARPAIDPLFRSAAVALGARVIGVLLTGHLDDGTAGLLAIHRAGGVTIVQDPDDAEAPGMPRNALAYVDVDHRLPLAQIPDTLIRLAGQPAAARDSAAARAVAGQVEVLRELLQAVSGDDAEEARASPARSSP